MGESYVPFPYVDEQLVAIEKSLSPARFARYLRATDGDRNHAARLYLYNARVAKAFLFPLSMSEVVLRNAVTRRLSATFGDRWFQSEEFQTLIPRTSVSSLRATAKRVKGKMLGTNGSDTAGDLVTSLPFDFWCSLFRSGQQDLWDRSVSSGFPNLTGGRGREDVWSLASKVSRFRNRVVHHEPIFEGIDLRAQEGDALRLIGMVCEDTASWVRHHSTVMHAIRTKPTREESFEPLWARANRDFEAVPGGRAMDIVIKAVRPDTRILVELVDHRPVRCILVTELLRHLASLRPTAEADLSKITMSETINSIRSQLRFVVLPEDIPYALAEAQARDQGARLILAAAREGVITRALLLPPDPEWG